MHSFCLVPMALVALLGGSPGGTFHNPETALADYVNAPDPAYSFAPVAAVPAPGFTAYVLRMTSQSWRTPEEVDSPLWSHWMVVILPHTVLSTTGMLIVGGDENSDPPPDANDGLVFVGSQLALATGTVVSIVYQVPNQPLTFADEPRPHREDDLVAYSWRKGMNTGDWSWPAYLPMVKSAVRALDTVQSFAPLVGAQVHDFVVIGFSKRGATTWLTAAVDPRVVAIAPGVIDFLNLAPHIEHQFEALGTYNEAISEYVAHKVVRDLRLPEGDALLEVVDPYRYLDVLTMPKFLLNASGDQFFLPDSARFYFHDLLGENLIRYVPNSDHSLSNTPAVLQDALVSVLSWYQTVVFRAPRPSIDWQLETDNVVRVTTSQRAALARLWQVHNPNARDFRLLVTGPAWTSTPWAVGADGSYRVEVAKPANGWTAYFVEMLYPGPAGLPQTYSTRIFVTPDTKPFELIDPIGDPKPASYWRRQLAAELFGHGHAEVPGPVLAGYLPIPIFDRYVTTLEEAADALLPGPAAGGAAAAALSACLALRFNVAHGSVGWYSRVNLGALGSGPLWQHWNRAHDAYLGGDSTTALRICLGVNRL